MISCAIIEQSDLTANKRYLASKAVPPNWIVYQATYANSDEFRRVLSCAIENLHRLDDQDPKILIISGHGIPRTGTDIESGDGTQIMFWDYKDYFRVLPPNLVIYLSACFGMYPSSSVLQSDDWNRPYVLGPLVDIKFEHANEFQQELLKIVEASTGAQLNEGLRSLVQRFNDKKSVRDMQYGGREWLFGMFDEDGNFFPSEFLGAQLAAPVEGKQFVVVRELIQREAGATPVTCIVENDLGDLQHVSLTELAGLVGRLEDLVGTRFEVVYQKISSDQFVDESRRMDYINIVKAKKRDLNR